MTPANSERPGLPRGKGHQLPSSSRLVDLIEGPTWRRRLVNVPAALAAAVVLVLGLPVTLLAGLLADAWRRAPGRLSTVRMVIMATWIALVELAFLVLLLGPLAFAWAISPGGRVAAVHHRLVGVWARLMVGAARRCLGFSLDIDPSVDVALPEPAIVASRHASYPDAILPLFLLTRSSNAPVAHVLMQELAMVPTIDICCHRLANHFVSRGKGRALEEEAALAELAARAGPPHGSVVIFPEGGLADAAKRRRILGRLAEAHPDRADRLAGLCHLIPPREGGLGAMLDAVPAADVVTIGHTGLEGAATLAALWTSVPFGHPVFITGLRHDRSTIPDDRDERIVWLDERWVELDAWVGRHRPT